MHIVCTFRNRNRIVNLNACIKLWCRMKVQKTHYIANCGGGAAAFGLGLYEAGVRCVCVHVCVCVLGFRVAGWQVLNCMFKLFGTETIINIASTHNNKMGLLLHVSPLVIVCVWYTIIFKLLYVLNRRERERGAHDALTVRMANRLKSEWESMNCIARAYSLCVPCGRCLQLFRSV